jgi:uncharacterized protein with HEPN domain
MTVRNDIVWAIAESDLPVLQREVSDWMNELNAE